MFAPRCPTFVASRLSEFTAMPSFIASRYFLFCTELLSISHANTSVCGGATAHALELKSCRRRAVRTTQSLAVIVCHLPQNYVYIKIQLYYGMHMGLWQLSVAKRRFTDMGLSYHRDPNAPQEPGLGLLRSFALECRVYGKSSPFCTCLRYQR